MHSRFDGQLNGWFINLLWANTPPLLLLLIPGVDTVGPPVEVPATGDVSMTNAPSPDAGLLPFVPAIFVAELLFEATGAPEKKNNY